MRCCGDTRRDHYGSKHHAHVDKVHKLIRQDTVTDAAVHDSQVLAAVLLDAKARRDVWADSPYRSEAIEAHLKTTGLRSKIHRKEYRHKPLTTQQQSHNRDRSRIRAHVAHIFGHQVTAMSGNLIRTVWHVRARLNIGMKNFKYNFHGFLGLASPQKAQNA